MSATLYDDIYYRYFRMPKESSSPEKNLRKQIANVKNQFRREKAVLEQDRDLLKEELEEYRRKDNETRRLNESIISSYKNTDHARGQLLTNSLKQLKEKHKHEIQDLVSQHSKMVIVLQGQIKSLKERLEQQGQVCQQVKAENERAAFIKIEQKESRQRYRLEEELRSTKAKVAVLESKLRKADQLVKTYRLHLDKINFQSQKHDHLNKTSLQNSRMADGFDIKRQQEQFLMSKLYKSKRDCEQSQFLKSQVLNQFDLRTANQQQQKREVRRSRRVSTRQWVEQVHESARKSKKYLEVNRESIQNLTSRISRAVSSLQKMKKGGERRNVEYFNQRLERKLRLR